MCFFYPVTVWQQNSQPSIPIKVFAGSINPVYSHSTSILIQVRHWKDAGKHCFMHWLDVEKIVFTLTLIYSIRQHIHTEEEEEEERGKIIRCGTRIERKTERALHLHFNLSFKTVGKPSHTTASIQAACQWKKEKTGGDKEEVGWCEMDQTMDVRKALLFSTNCRQKREKEWRRSGGVW